MEKTYTDLLIKKSKQPKKKKKQDVVKKLKKRLHQPLIKGGRRTSLGGGRVRVSSSAGIKGFFK